MFVNNEIGTIQPIKKLGEICRKKKIFFHTDAAQAYGKIPIDVQKMNIDFVEADLNHENTEFCGASLYRPQPPRNPKLAPKHYAEGAKGKFIPHTAEEQEQIMIDYCSQFTTDKVVCYCHYCLEGLLMGKTEGIHIAQLMFPETNI